MHTMADPNYIDVGRADDRMQGAREMHEKYDVDGNYKSADSSLNDSGASVDTNSTFTSDEERRHHEDDIKMTSSSEDEHLVNSPMRKGTS